MYFFEKDEVKRLLEAEPRGGKAGEGMFEVKQIGEDRRMVRVYHRYGVNELIPARQPEGEVADVPDMAAGQGDQEGVAG